MFIWFYRSSGAVTQFRKHSCPLVGCMRVGGMLIIVAFQFTYTTLFGVLVSYIYIRTGSILAAISAHMVCNFLSFPSPEFLDEDSPTYPKRKRMFAAFDFHVLTSSDSFSVSCRHCALCAAFHNLPQPFVFPKSILFPS